MKSKIDIADVARRYNALDVIIDDDDKWHLETKREITKYIYEVTSQLQNFHEFRILNAGSAGFSYGLSEKNMVHLDVAENHIKHLPNSVLCSVEDMPFENHSFNLIICVGSVLNYCDPIKVIAEFSRVLAVNGNLILEFESSKTFELLLKRGFNKSATFVETFFDAYGEKESLWYFSEKYIHELLRLNYLKVLHIRRFHIVSPLIYRLTKNTNQASSFIKFDSVMRHLPFLNKFSSNIILSSIKE